MTNEEAKKAGFRNYDKSQYTYWQIAGRSIHQFHCYASSLREGDFPTRAKAREALRRRKMEEATKREDARIAARKAAGTQVPPPTPSETPADKDARIKALVDFYKAGGGPITKEQLTDEVRVFLSREGKCFYSFHGLHGEVGRDVRDYTFVAGWPRETALKLGQAYWNKADAEHAKWLADMQAQTTPITPEQAKMLRDGDSFYMLDPISLDGIAKVTWVHIEEARKVDAIGCYFTRAAAQAAIYKAKDKAKHKPCDMQDEITFNGAEYRRLADNEQHKDGDIPVDGSQTHRFGSIWYRPVASHETPVGETQSKEVVTDETQNTEPVKCIMDGDEFCGITPEWKAWKARQDAKESNKEPVAQVEVTSSDVSESEKLSNKPNAVSHPSHYTSHPSGVECITITKHMNFCRGNAVKYLWRAGQKGDSLDKEIEDIAKAEEYCRIEKERLIAKKGEK